MESDYAYQKKLLFFDTLLSVLSGVEMDTWHEAVLIYVLQELISHLSVYCIFSRERSSSTTDPYYYKEKRTKFARTAIEYVRTAEFAYSSVLNSVRWTKASVVSAQLRSCRRNSSSSHDR